MRRISKVLLVAAVVVTLLTIVGPMLTSLIAEADGCNNGSVYNCYHTGTLQCGFDKMACEDAGYPESFCYNEWLHCMNQMWNQCGCNSYPECCPGWW